MKPEGVDRLIALIITAKRSRGRAEVSRFGPTRLARRSDAFCRELQVGLPLEQWAMFGGRPLAVPFGCGPHLACHTRSGQPLRCPVVYSRLRGESVRGR